VNSGTGFQSTGTACRSLKLVPVIPTSFRESEYCLGAYHEAGAWVHHASPREFAVGLDVLRGYLNVLAVCAAPKKIPGTFR
jgi:hypothetical protein